MSPKKKLISIVIPVFNEVENLPVLYEQLCSVVKELHYDFEFVFVDDGSTDETLAVLSVFASSDRRVKGLSFSRNFGHQAALIAGLDVARGDAVITMDGDLQHPPHLLPRLIEQWRAGNDIVATLRRETADADLFKRMTAKMFYAIINRFGNIRIPPNSADFRLLSRRVVDELKHLDERALFLRGLVQWVGFKQAWLEYDAAPRRAGKTKYSLRRMMGFALDGIASFSTAPLTAALYFGLSVSALSFIYGIYAIYTKLFTTTTLPGWTSVLASVLFLGGVQLMTIGVIGIYLGKLFAEVKRRPRYIVQASVGIRSPKRPSQVTPMSAQKT